MPQLLLGARNGKSFRSNLVYRQCSTEQSSTLAQIGELKDQAATYEYANASNSAEAEQA
jgi:hypothetical protein